MLNHNLVKKIMDELALKAVHLPPLRSETEEWVTKIIKKE